MKTFHELAIHETVDSLQETNTNITDNPFRLGSMMYFEVIKEARKRLAEGRFRLTEVDRQIIETDLGEFEIYEGNMVPLDSSLISIIIPCEPLQIELSISKFTVHITAAPFFNRSTCAEGMLLRSKSISYFICIWFFLNLALYV